jgi:dTDP-4-dehydrorhamnose 3,5-epimerase-like enzyme
MLPQAIAEPLTPSRDARGFVVEPLSLAQLTAQQNVHVVWTAAGAVRGNHHHVRGTEVALVLGPALVRYRDANGIQDVEITKGTLYRFTFPPKVAHAFAALGPEPMFLVGFNTEIHDSEHPDAIPDHILGADDIAKFV